MEKSKASTNLRHQRGIIGEEGRNSSSLVYGRGEVVDEDQEQKGGEDASLRNTIRNRVPQRNKPFCTNTQSPAGQESTDPLPTGGSTSHTKLHTQLIQQTIKPHTIKRLLDVKKHNRQ
jgi:hypothetical protein